MSTFQIKKILIPVDFSKASLKPLDHAVDLAKKCNAEITLLHVIEPIMANTEPGYFAPPLYLNDHENTLTIQSDVHLKNIVDKIVKKGVKSKTLIASGNIRDKILKTAQRIKADIIVLGTHGVSGFKEFFIGSNTFKVIKEAECPVLSVQRHHKPVGFKNIVLPFRDKPHSREKVNYAIDLALLYDATIHVLGIDTEYTDSHKRKIQLEAAQIKNIAEKKGASCKVKVITSDYLADTVLKHAFAMKADLIMAMSSLDKMYLKEYFTGPFSQQMVNHSPIPVLSIHPKFNTDTIDLRFY